MRRVDHGLRHDVLQDHVAVAVEVPLLLKRHGIAVHVWFQLEHQTRQALGEVVDALLGDLDQSLGDPLRHRVRSALGRRLAMRQTHSLLPIQGFRPSLGEFRRANSLAIGRVSSWPAASWRSGPCPP